MEEARNLFEKWYKKLAAGSICPPAAQGQVTVLIMQFDHSACRKYGV